MLYSLSSECIEKHLLTSLQKKIMEKELVARASCWASAISIVCMCAIAIVLPILHYRLDTAYTSVERRMTAFKVQKLKN